MASLIHTLGFSTFLPTIINGIGFTSLQAQYLTIPIYSLGGISFFLVAYFADRTGRRALFMLCFGIFPIIGYILLLASYSNGVRYFACYVIIFGGYTIVALNITWINGNIAPHYKRATALGMNQTIGNLAGVIAGQIYIASESPRYKTGQAVSLTSICLAWALVWVMAFHLTRLNKQKAAKILAGEGGVAVGDRNVHYKYMI